VEIKTTENEKKIVYKLISVSFTASVLLTKQFNTVLKQNKIFKAKEEFSLKKWQEN
jgi:hypothetical protein